MLDASGTTISFHELDACNASGDNLWEKVVGIDDQGLEHPGGCDRSGELLSESGDTHDLMLIKADATSRSYKEGKKSSNEADACDLGMNACQVSVVTSRS